jgi:hypothetical protein
MKPMAIGMTLENLTMKPLAIGMTLEILTIEVSIYTVILSMQYNIECPNTTCKMNRQP